ncbi:MAG: PASTA domain-containing protein [Actinomycetota bacterium]
MRDLVGGTLGGRYQLVARVAGGGMGEVYRAHDLLLDRAVAVKVLQHALASDPRLVERFKQEARAAARLTHPNVVAVYDWGSEDDHTYYMVMEFVPGTDLRDVMVSRGTLDPGHATRIMTSVCDALAAAHETGLVHRDVKPENVLISRAGTVKVADFGIAVVVDAERTNPTGVVPGTLRYLSPEQAAGKEASPASDIWGAGAILAELVTGRPPRQGSAAEILRRRAEEAPEPPSSYGPRVPKAIDRIVMRACAVDPADRFDSAEEMAGALRRAEGDMGATGPIEELVEDVTGEIRLPDMEPTAFGPRHRVHRPHKVRTVAFALVALLMLFGAVRAGAQVFGPGNAEVPELIGMTLEEARAAAENAGFEINVLDHRADVRADEGEVLRQDPPTGLLREGSPIGVIVSSGKPHTFVPSIVGMDLATAKVRLASRQLKVGEIRRRFDAKPEGTVIGQDPKIGDARWGSSVILIVSRGPRTIPVPDVTKLTVPKAKQKLIDAGFEVTVVGVYSDSVGKGKVVETSPPGGSEAPEGSVIEIARSLGPEFKKVRVPDVRNMSLSAARAKLEALGLRVWVREVEECGGGGTVADTDPLPGTIVRENDRVALFIVC